MKYLIVYYSRTGNSANIAKKLSAELDSSIEKLEDNRNRSGFGGYMISGWEALRKKTPEINATTTDPAKFDMVIIGTPVWAANMSSPVRTYINKYNKYIENYALFCTYKGSGAEKTFSKIKKLFSTKASATMDVFDREIAKNKCSQKISRFIENISDI